MRVIGAFVVMMACGCASTHKVLVREEYIAEWRTYSFPFRVDEVLLDRNFNIHSADNCAGWLAFYFSYFGPHGPENGKKVFQKALREHCPLIIRVALYDIGSAYEILVETGKNIKKSVEEITGKGWLAFSVELLSDRYPIIKGVRKKTTIDILYSTSDMEQALLLTGSVGVVEVIPGAKEPVWHCKLRLLQRLPMRVEENKVVFTLPKRLLVKNAKITDVWARVHMMILPGKPLTCNIPDLLLLPTVHELWTMKRCVYDRFNVIWDFSKTWRK